MTSPRSEVSAQSEYSSIETNSSGVEINEEALADLSSGNCDFAEVSQDMSSEGSGDEVNNIDEDEDIVIDNETTTDPKRRKLSCVQQVSFHKIRNDSIDLESKEVIERIITKYNENKNTKIKYELKKQIDLGEGEQFQIMIYIQTRKGSSRLLKSYGILFEHNNFNAVIFYFKSDCVYAITKGSGWRLIQGYVDYDFPQKVAARILSEKGRLSSTNKKLLGNAKSAKHTYLIEEPTNPFKIPELCTKFTARLRNNASIRKLQCFSNIGNSSISSQVRQSSDIKVEIGFGLVRFKREFEVEDFPLILDHLNKIDRGEQTLTTEGEVEKTSEAYYQYLQKVSLLKEEELNLFLIKQIQDDIQSYKLNLHQRFNLCHKHTEDFLLGSDYNLCYKGHVIKRFRTTPTLASILTNLQTDVKCRALHNQNYSTEDFRKRLCEVTISYKKMDETITSDKLMNYIEGNIFYKNQVYWRVMTKWCCVTEDYIKLIQREFVRLLNKHLVAYNELCQLKKPWKINVKESVYNNSYASEDGYIVGDLKIIKTIELFDLMLHDQDSNSTFVYHVKKGFGQSTREACSQLVNSAKIISRRMQGNSPEPGIIEEFYENYTNTQKLKKQELLSFMSTCDDFKRVLEKPTFVYAVAPRDNLRPEAFQLPIDYYYGNERHRDASRSLHLEGQTKEKIFANDISSLLKELKKNSFKIFKEICDSLCVIDEGSEEEYCQTLGEIIVDQLKKGKYINSKGEVMSKLLLCTKESFKLLCFQGNSKKFKSSQDNIFYLLSPYRTFFNSLGAKLEVIRTRNELSKLGFDFNICEIITEN